jgi:hypothetical protein
MYWKDVINDEREQRRQAVEIAYIRRHLPSQEVMSW